MIFRIPQVRNSDTQTIYRLQLEIETWISQAIHSNKILNYYKWKLIPNTTNTNVATFQLINYIANKEVSVSFEFNYY